MTDNVPEVLSRLRAIVERWPKDPTENHPVVLSRMDALLSESFDPLDFYDRVQTLARVERIDSEDGTAVVCFDDGKGWSQRAAFELSAPGHWRLVSMKSQCTICFGSGENDGKECLMRNGKGWE